MDQDGSAGIHGDRITGLDISPTYRCVFVVGVISYNPL